MELQGSSPYSKEPTTCSYPEPDRSSLCPPTHPTSRRSILILSSHPRLCLSSGLLLSGFPTKSLYAPLLSLYVPHVLPISGRLTNNLSKHPASESQSCDFQRITANAVHTQSQFVILCNVIQDEYNGWVCRFALRLIRTAIVNAD